MRFEYIDCAPPGAQYVKKSDSGFFFLRIFYDKLFNIGIYSFYIVAL